MPENNTKEAIILLEDGTLMKGKAIGKTGTTYGELCFNTGMTGYQEVFTDPSYFGQILIMTSSHIGNYGALTKEMESDSVKISGMVCKNYEVEHSRAMTEESLQHFFEEYGLVGISDVDTRSLVRHIRSKGAMNAIISSELETIDQLKEELAKAPSMAGLELATKVTTKKPYFVGNESAKHKVAVLDLGIKKNILRCLADRDCYLKVFPANATFEEMKAWDPTGYFISNGPGDPEPLTFAVETVQQIMEKDEPLFGICLGHQVLALANGVSTYKMHHGHRGLNHPVKNIINGNSEITSQNHGFEVNREDIEKSDKVEITHVNLNDNTVEGIRVKGKNAFSVQYHPESSPGPHDSRYLFDQFIQNMQ